jgi:hypothetical protein
MVTDRSGTFVAEDLNVGANNNVATVAGNPVGGWATPDVRNSRFIEDFDDSVDEYALFDMVMPSHYEGDYVTVKLWMAATSSTDTNSRVAWEVAFDRLQAGVDDIDQDSWAAAKRCYINPAATCGQVTTGTITFSNSEIDSIAAGDVFRVFVRRRILGDSTDIPGMRNCSCWSCRNPGSRPSAQNLR